MAVMFPEQNSDETVIIFIRKHFIVLIRLLAAASIIFFLPALVAFVVMGVYLPYSLNPKLFIILSLFILLYMLYGLLFLSITMLEEEFDLFILTSDRLVDYTQDSLFRRSVALTPLDQIQDTTAHVPGLFGSLLNYGKVEVETAAGTASNFCMDHVPGPAEVSKIILDAAKAYTLRRFPPMMSGSPLPHAPGSDSEKASAQT